MANVNIEKVKINKLIEFSIILVLILLAIFLTFQARKAWKEYDYVGKSSEIQGTISITGEGKISAVPDIAKISVGMTTEAKTVIEAQKNNNEKMNSIILTLKKQGIEERDIKTSNYSVYPKYDWSNGKNLIIGYTVSQSLDIKIRDTKKVSDVLDVVGQEGANQVGNLVFAIDNPEELEMEARNKAILDAKNKAKDLTDKLDVKLGKVISYYSEEGGNNQHSYKAIDFGLGGERTEAMMVSPDIQQGENEINSRVTIVFEIL